nr:T9SS type A sorting domain-containing protein [Saprospiraceae bacterium]
MQNLLLNLLIPFVLFFGFTATLWAFPDTTHVRVHDGVDMVWFERYDRTGYFPLEDKTFHKVWMVATLGCASGGCSDWDYTVNLHILDEDNQEFELGRLITPYGGYMANNSQGFNNNWSHRYIYEVTDFVNLFQDSTTIRAFYSGWSAGFSMTIDFYFIEGQPEREVLGIENIVHGSHHYTDANTYNNEHTPPVTLTVPEGTVEAKLRYLPSGHGFDNSVFCAEFCPRQYYLSVDGNQVGNGLIWKSDCGLNPIFPQGGTWVYDRANWCPGEAVPLHEYELGGSLTPGGEHTFELNLESYNWSGSQTPSYTTSYQVVFYGERNIQRDAELVEIISPSSHEDHLRHNPICAEPVVKVKNNGAEDIGELVVEYGFPGGYSCTYTWSGNLEFGESVEVVLPALRWSELDTDNPKFYAKIISVNGSEDEVDYNNELQSDIEIPRVFNDLFVLNFVTNSRSGDFTYGIYREGGDPVLERVPNAPNSLFSDTLNLEPGCYYFEVVDQQGLGLADWPTGQGNGSISFRRPIGPIFTSFLSLQRDFGSHTRLNFTVGYSLEEEPDRGGCGFPVTVAENLSTKEEIEIYPNPAIDHLRIVSAEANEIKSIRLMDVSGSERFSIFQINSNEYRMEIPNNVISGFYLLEVRSQYGTITEPLMIVR